MTEALLSPPSSSPSVDGSSIFDLLCACAHVDPSRDQIARIVDFDCDSFDWDGFLAATEHHAVLPLAARNLTQYAQNLPAEIRQSLHSSYDFNLRRSLWFTLELERIVAHFTKRELPVVPYKGPVLAQSAYGDVGLRSFSDLDLLILPADFERAKRTLGELGYNPSQELSPAIERLWLRTGYERSFDSDTARHIVELQWGLLPDFYAIDFRAAGFRIQDLMERAGRISLGGAEIPCLSLEDSLLALCMHAGKHLWTRLIWIADIAQSLKDPELDLAGALSRARTLGISRIVGVSCWLAETLLGETLGASGQNLVERDPEVARLGAFYADRLSRTPIYNFDSTDYFRRIWSLRERSSDRWRYLWRLILTPGPGEIAAIRLPEVLFPLYRVVRMGRLAGRFIR